MKYPPKVTKKAKLFEVTRKGKQHIIVRVTAVNQSQTKEQHFFSQSTTFSRLPTFVIGTIDG
jgi:hypothetical protein